MKDLDLQIDKTLEALYDAERKGELGPSSPNVSRWLGGIRTYFPNTVVKVMQQDALKRLNLTSTLLEKEMLENVEPDVHLVATLMTLSRVIPAKTKDTARQVVRKVVEDLMKKLAQLDDPVELLFGVQLGGGTDINRALTYCQQVTQRPTDTVLVLITDLFDGGDNEDMCKRAKTLVEAGVQVVVLLALNDEGAPSYDHGNAEFMASLGILYSRAHQINSRI